MSKRGGPLRSLNSGRDEYETRLRELFDESDESDKGHLNTVEVQALCSRLQLGRLRDRLIRALGERCVDKEKVEYGEFRHVFFALLEELEAQQSKSPRKQPQSASEDKPDQSPKATPKLVLGRKQYGRRSLPISEDFGATTVMKSQEQHKSPPPPEGSYSQFLRDLDTNDRSSPSVDVVNKHMKRRRQARGENQTAMTSTAGPSEETYEAQGLLPTEEDVGTAPDDRSILQQLRDVCGQAGLPDTGTLNLAQFAAVCAHIGLADVTEQGIKDMFFKMDHDSDGLISLPELMKGLPKSSPFHSSSTLHPHLGTSSRRQSAGRAASRSRSSSRTRTADKAGMSSGTLTHTFFSGDFSGVFSTLEHNQDGFAEALDIIDFWEGVGVLNGADILVALDFNPKGKVKLSDLTAALSEELANQAASEQVRSAAILSFQHEVRHLKSAVEQAEAEKKKLRLDLSESTAHNALLAREVDDRHAQLDSSWEKRLMTVERKYQDQVRQLQQELDREREAGAAQASRLRSQLEELQAESAREEARLVEQLASDQKEMNKLEKELLESADKLHSVSKQNEQLKKDLLKRREQGADQTEVPETYKAVLLEKEQLLAKRQEDNKRLQDHNDELLAQLEQMKQAQQVAKKATQSSTRTQASRIPVPSRRLSVSSIEASEDEDPTNPFSSARGDKSGSGLSKRQRLAWSTPSLNTDYADGPSLSKELIQRQTEEMLEKDRKEQEVKFKANLDALKKKHEEETSRLLHNFEQEKEWLTTEQKISEETALVEQARDLHNASAQQRQELARQHEADVAQLQLRHQQEIIDLQNRLKQVESNMEGNEKLAYLVQSLEAQLAASRDELDHLDTQRSQLEVQLRQQEVSLRAEFDGERQNLAERFSRELEQRQISHKHQMEQLFARGAEGLTGKLRDDFLSLVRKHTEEEVGHSQAAILTQLHRDRSGMAAVLEQEKSYLFEEAEQQRLALTEKYDSQVKALRLELAQLRGQLEAEKQAVAAVLQEGELARQEDSRNAESRSEEVVQNLRREMEAELVSELERIKESFEAEKRELETQKTPLEEELAELQGHLEAERNKTSEMSALKETLKALKAEKREVENMAEGMKEKLYQAYQQKGAEQSDLETKVQMAHAEGHTQGEQQGFHQGKTEGLKQGKQEGYADGFAEGRQRGIEEGRLQVNEESYTLEKKMEEQLEVLRSEKASLEKRLRQEKENSTRLNQMAQGRDQLKHSFDQILAEKDMLTARYDEAITALTEQHEEEKAMLKSEIAHLEEQRLTTVAEKAAAQAQLDALTKEISRQAMAKFEVEDSPRLEDQALTIPQNRNAIQEEMEQLKLKLREAEVAQKGLELLKEEREGLIRENSELEEALKKLRAKSQTEEGTKIKAQMAEINSLNEEKQKMKELLDQSSDQLMKASTSMALAQSNFVRQLEEMKRQQPKSSADVESYTRLQVSLLEHQRLVIVLQDTIREREGLVRTVVQEGEDALHHVTQISEAKLKDTQERLDWTHDLLVKQTEKYNQQVSLNQRNAELLKDLYVENSELIKNLADNVAQTKKLHKKCAAYKKSFRKLRNTVEDSAWVAPILERV
ncbi:hypothetical protein RRG08_004364 [Elysia crispata]|uniref:EF-hand domain-containing protein n=1 Tax=Elysia crispata TaxID=231223 RepID=A0AAE0Z6X5_9GAST|nr:hypothetical protein RRG08_004364 [Elysia crispata]